MCFFNIIFFNYVQTSLVFVPTWILNDMPFISILGSKMMLTEYKNVIETTYFVLPGIV